MDDTLIALLVEEGIIDRAEGVALGEEAKKESKSVEELLRVKKHISEEILAKAKAKILKIPFKKIAASSISADLLALIPRETMRTYGVMPISRANNMLVIGMVNPADPRAGEAMRFVAKQNKVSLGAYLVTQSNVDEVLARLEPPPQPTIAREYAGAKDASTVGLRSTTLSASGSRVVVSEEAPAIKLVSQYLTAAVERGASDAHFEPGRTKMRVRFRIDGVLEEVGSVGLEVYTQLLSRIKILANLKIDENRIPQDGRFRMPLLDRDIDFRVSTFPTPFGEKAAIRVLDPKTGLRQLKDLGIVGRNQELILESIKKPFGAILLTGPTGSGKTTTLYALMQLLNRDSVNIVSLEDPVEYSMEGINQSQVKPEIGYDFASGLRQILRQDPDIIMIGEIRDSETAELAIHAALTGHVVLSTLHTNNSLGVIPRLVDLGVKPFLLQSSINVMMAQRLVLRLCDSCKKEESLPADQKAIVEKELAKLPAGIRPKGSLKLFRAKGCTVCHGKGSSGRVAIMEIFQMTPEVARIVAKNGGEEEYAKEAAKQGMITLRQDGILKALEGLVNLDEVLKESESDQSVEAL